MKITEQVRVGRLVAVSKDGRHWLVRCDCGVTKRIAESSLQRGLTRSCGCLRNETAKRGNTTQGMSKTRTFRIWCGMLDRCRNPRNHAYKYYGGKGVKVDDRWREFSAFLADMGEAPAGMTLDRIDSADDYKTENCRWATRLVQSRNRRNTVRLTIAGVTKTVVEWSQETGLPATRIWHRIRMKYPEHSMLAPSHPGVKP